MYLVDTIIETLQLDPNLQLKKKIRGLPGITGRELIYALISTKTVEEAAEFLGYSINPIKQAISSYLKPLCLKKSKTFNEGGYNTSYRYILLNIVGYAYCNKCNSIKKHSMFGPNIYHSNNKSSNCLNCENIKSKRYKYSLVIRTPKWSDKKSIRLIYNSCPEGYHIDHIIPLKGKLVSGLHVANNLQPLKAEDNLKKSNKYIP